MQLNDLYDDVLLHVINYCDRPTKALLRYVSRKWFAFIPPQYLDRKDDSTLLLLWKCYTSAERIRGAENALPPFFDLTSAYEDHTRYMLELFFPEIISYEYLGPCMTCESHMLTAGVWL